MVSRPGAVTEEVSPVGRVSRSEELTLEGGQGLGVFTDEQGVGQFQQVLPLGGGQLQAQGSQKAFQGRRGPYNTSQHEVTSGQNELLGQGRSIPGEPHALSTRRFARVESCTPRSRRPG